MATWKSASYEGRYLQLTITETVNVAANTSTPDDLRSVLKGIQADGKTLTFCFHDGHTVQREWTHPSRANSWTPEMKKAASEKTKQQRRNQNAKSGHGNSGNH